MVLIVSQILKKAVFVSHMFYRMNIITYPCIPNIALNEISTNYNAVLIIEPNDLPDTANFVKKLRSQAPVPIFAITNDTKNCRDAHTFDKVFRNSILSGNLVELICDYMRANKLPYIGDYKYAGLNTQFVLKSPTYYFSDIEVTKTERMILSYLIATRHEQQSGKNIIKYAFEYGKTPSVSCVRSHISQINKKFIAFTTRKIIGCNPGTGYYILSPANRSANIRKKDKYSHIV